MWIRAIAGSAVTMGIAAVLSSQAIGACMPGGQDTSKWRSVGDMHAKISKLIDITRKSEFETSKVWAERYVHALANEDIYLTNSYWIEIFPQSENIKYNADTQSLDVPAETFRSSVYRCEELLPYQLMYDLYNTSCINKSRGITAQEINSEGPSYRGTNAYGATRNVDQSNYEFVTLFEGPIGYDDIVWGVDVDKGKAPLFSLPVPIAMAPDAKRNVRFAALIKLTYPLAATYVKGFRATFDFPTRLEYTYKTLIVDLQCIAMVVPNTKLFIQRELP